MYSEARLNAVVNAKPDIHRQAQRVVARDGAKEIFNYRILARNRRNGVR